MKKSLLVLMLTGVLFADLTPVNEGMYTVSIECREAQPELCQAVEGNQTMLMFATHSGDIMIGISRKDTPIEKYAFPAAKFNAAANRYEAVGTNALAMPVEMVFQLTDGAVLGWIRDSRFQNDLRITGQRTANTSSLYLEKGTTPLQPGDVIGVYNGATSNGVTVKLIMQKKLLGGPNEFFATGLLNNIAETSFPDAEIDAVNSIVNLYSPIEDGLQTKWTLKYKTDGNVRKLEGFALLPRKAEIINISLTRSEGP